MRRWIPLFVAGIIATICVIAIESRFNPGVTASAIAIVVIIVWLSSKITPAGKFNPVAVVGTLLLTAILGIGGVVVVSTWMNPLVLIGMTYALIFLVVFLDHKRAVVDRREISGQCQNCGYDLRASPERCPECGKPITGDLERRRRIAAKLAAARNTDEHQIQSP